MIIDSHAHYAHPKYNVEIPYLCEENGEWAIRRADRERLICEMREAGIVGFVEPSIGFDAIESQLSLVSSHSDFMWAAVGVHPTRCFKTEWKNRKRLEGYAKQVNAIAIGETGLDYHHDREEQHRIMQKRWFIYQLKLADKMKLPMVLHIRMADRDALKILKRHKRRLHGGVAHCFTGNYQIAEEYIKLGLAIGIGAKLLDDDEGRDLREAVAHVSLSSILVETDAPFVMPEIDEELCRGNARKKLCNSSFILPAIIRKIAQIRGESYETVEEAVYKNTVRVYGLK